MMRSAGGTIRFHTKPTIGNQTVAEHSYHVAMICIALSAGSPSVNLLKAALYHDLAETETGDVPAPAKWRCKELDTLLSSLEREFETRNGLDVELTGEEALMLKHADALELAFYCVDQIMLGNRHMVDIYHNITQYLCTLGQLTDSVAFERVFNNLQEKFYDATN